MRPLPVLLAAAALLVVAVPAARSQSLDSFPFNPRLPAPPGCCQPLYQYPGSLYSMPSQSPQTPDGKETSPLSTPSSIGDTAAQAGAAPTPSADAGTGAGQSAGIGFNPAMFGDLIGGPTVITKVRINGNNPLTTTPGAVLTATSRQPLLNRGTFKIADNDSPRPVDRVFVTYNYFDTVNTFTSGIPGFNVNREMFGFEKTFAYGNGSFQMRLPYLQLENAVGAPSSNISGDMTLVLKYAVINDRQTGNVLSGGVALTLPTGDSFLAATGETIHDTLIQPWVGYIYNLDRLYVQGYLAVVVPTDSRDATLLFNDIGLGYWAYRNPDPTEFFRGIVPTIEAHLLDPLSHRGSQSLPVGLPDYLTFTGGVNFVFGTNSTLGFALGTPVTGPRPYNYEGTVALNIRF